MIHGGNLTYYARNIIPPETRLERFVSGEKRLTWTGLFREDFPKGELFLVGGTVRDIILGKQPRDIDLVVRGVELDVLESWLIQHGAVDLHQEFGTFTFILHGSSRLDSIDIALPRTEHLQENHHHGRKDLLVEFDPYLSIQQDLTRRDFTVNAMAFSLKSYRLIDPFLGLQDLYAGLLNSVLTPEIRFQEDATRILRGLRLSSQLQFGIERLTWQALKKAVPLLQTLKKQENGQAVFAIPRALVGKEFLLGFYQHPVHTLHLWKESRALDLFSSFINFGRDTEETKKIEQILSLLYTPAFLEQHDLRRPSATLLLAALFAFLPEQKSTDIKKFLHVFHLQGLPEKHPAHFDANQFIALLSHKDDFHTIDPASLSLATIEKRYVTQEGRELLALMHGIFIVSGVHSIARERLHTVMKIVNDLAYHAAQEGFTRLPKLISGSDIKTYKVPEGPLYRDLLDLIRSEQLAGRIHTREEALEYLHRSIQSAS